MRDDDHGGAGVSVDGRDISAQHIQEAVDLALGVVESPGARPAVGPAENSTRSKVVVNAPKLFRDQVFRIGQLTSR
jgi:hypothetical protein